MKVEEQPTVTVIDMKVIKLPGWVWIALAGLIMYLARTYITDSGLVELIGLGVYMGLKYVEVQVNSGQLETVADWIRRAHNEILTWRAKNAPPTAMRSSTPDPAAKPIQVKRPSKWFEWAFD